jgi:hypothetical protein
MSNFLKNIFRKKQEIQVEDSRIKIESNVEWNELEEVITQTENLTTGKEKIINFISRNYAEFSIDFLNEIELEKIKSELLRFTEDTITKELLLTKVKSVNFGIFESNESNYLIYFCGTSNGIEDEDWACEPEYFPKNYLKLHEFETVRSELKKYKGDISEIEQLVINGFVNLVLKNSFTELEKLIGLKNIGSGFDSGDIFIIRAI